MAISKEDAVVKLERDLKEMIEKIYTITDVFRSKATSTVVSSNNLGETLIDIRIMSENVKSKAVRIKHLTDTERERMAKSFSSIFGLQNALFHVIKFMGIKFKVEPEACESVRELTNYMGDIKTGLSALIYLITGSFEGLKEAWRN